MTDQQAYIVSVTLMAIVHLILIHSIARYAIMRITDMHQNYAKEHRERDM